MASFNHQNAWNASLFQTVMEISTRLFGLAHRVRLCTLQVSSTCKYCASSCHMPQCATAPSKTSYYLNNPNNAVNYLGKNSREGSSAHNPYWPIYPFCSKWLHAKQFPIHRCIPGDFWAAKRQWQILKLNLFRNAVWLKSIYISPCHSSIASNSIILSIPMMPRHKAHVWIAGIVITNIHANLKTWILCLSRWI